MRPKDAKSNDQLHEELFELVEESQGYAFISDAKHGDAIEIARAALYWTRVTANKLQGFIKSNER